MAPVPTPTRAAPVRGCGLVSRPAVVTSRPAVVAGHDQRVVGSGWDPADPSSGNAWENQAVFDYDGRLLPAARWFSHR
ncbi:hypothetical protein [Streptomyces fulvorobeus]|uniref:Arabinogalactan endo-1,4-beta-galactosidase n=1 Tax=Streptomyces fulvorobeus TaxID=284028 RepID=A0A7J0C1I1_9ACTN|nr:hypothetical protein [Streptomyces fulvorobeus]NYE40114.1 arabinogalactan endo-1,4-beta-galactosidase [Streptomyces fulvorobeus]GFM96379.1 hypothetical protein Sfulv_11900 [Streptomyces fulvorobeus]